MKYRPDTGIGIGASLAEAIKKVAERASMEFPESRIVVSTLLPHTDFPPHIIRDINAELTRSCTALPNVYTAHHPSIGPQDLYDGLHIHKDGGLGRKVNFP